jgi:transcriptional regulator with XRE-family HTH domain
MPLFSRNATQADLAGGRLARQAAASLAGLLAVRGTTRAKLAAAMGVSPGRVSQILSGDANLTVRSLAAAADALGACVEIRFFDPPEPAEEPPSAVDRSDSDGASSFPGGFVASRAR